MHVGACVCAQNKNNVALLIKQFHQNIISGEKLHGDVFSLGEVYAQKQLG